MRLTMAINNCIFLPLQLPSSLKSKDHIQSSNVVLRNNKQSQKFKFKTISTNSSNIHKATMASLRSSDSKNHFTIGVTPGAHPEHLVVLVNGIIGSAENWRFAAEQFKLKLADTVLIHCSASNSALKTFHGVDVMGHRLAKEVQSVIREIPGVTKISFLAHSLGGLIARYAIGQLYNPPNETNVLENEDNNTSHKEDDDVDGDQQGEYNKPHLKNLPQASTSYGTMAGLEPANFITVATPHLGSRGSRQLPFLLGLAPFEKIAPLVAHWFVGKTGRHLFLTDGDSNHLPLLRRMVTDCDEGKFISALRAFRQRTLYANVLYDYMVGWQTSSIRRASEMPQIKHEPISPNYPHIVRDEELPPCSISLPSTSNMYEGGRCIEEMVTGLQQVSWRRVDVSFVGATSRFLAHNTIQVKTSTFHREGADVIYHILDNHF
ncbi:hypothetical protein M758_6G152600 [Ceratodon purpureus]|nr:hypothetical protein M758_6G152600 [Ceratodon purpureus]